MAEKRTALITRAVTRGLNPNAPTKDSGIPWLGEIPAHWEVKKVKQVVDIFGRIGFRGYTLNDIVDEGQGALSLSPSNVLDGEMTFENKTYISWEKYHESPEIKVSKYDLLFVKTGSTIGKATIVRELTEPMTVNPQIVVLKNCTIYPLFLNYTFNSSYYQFEVDGYKFGGSTPAMTQTSLGRTLIVIPNSIQEQIQICIYIETELEKIESLKKKIISGIKKLKEYRSSLITHAVTGKIDVREYAYQTLTL